LCAVHRDDDLLKQVTQQPLTVVIGGGWGIPDPLQVGSCGLQALSLLRVQRHYVATEIVKVFAVGLRKGALPRMGELWTPRTASWSTGHGNGEKPPHSVGL
jgi:hypothetical protein